MLCSSECMVVVQAVEEEGEETKTDEFGGGVLRKRQKAARHEQQSDGENADLQQVSSSAHVSRLWCTVLCHADQLGGKDNVFVKDH